MSNTRTDGLHITPLALWIAGALGGALWTVLFVLGMEDRQSQEEMQRSLTTLVTSQAYDRREIDTIKGEVRDISEEIGVIAERVGKIEALR